MSLHMMYVLAVISLLIGLYAAAERQWNMFNVSLVVIIATIAGILFRLAS